MASATRCAAVWAQHDLALRCSFMLKVVAFAEACSTVRVGTAASCQVLGNQRDLHGAQEEAVVWSQSTRVPPPPRLECSPADEPSTIANSDEMNACRLDL